MKTKIRKSVYETNSSSSHSICIADNNTMLMDTELIPDQNGDIELDGGQFGWEWEKYNDALTKANYAAIFSRNDSKWRNLLEEVIKVQTGASNVQFNINDDSYIDHQSDVIEGGSATEAFESQEKLRHFIFNKNSWLFTGNDNSTSDPTFYDVPIFKDGKKIMPEYKYELIIDGYKETTKFKEKPSEEKIHEALRSLLQEVDLYANGGQPHFNNDNSIYAQIMKSNSPNKPFKFEYGCPITENEIEFRKEAWHDANQKYKNEFGHLNLDWGKEGYNKCKEIEKELIKNHPEKYVYKVGYKVEEIGNNSFLRKN